MLRGVETRVGRFRGCEGAWGKEVRGALGSAVGVGVALGVLKGVCDGLGVLTVGQLRENDEIKKRIGVEVLGLEKRFSGGWAVPRVWERKA